jgi:hypothetical protein
VFSCTTIQTVPCFKIPAKYARSGRSGQTRDD